MGCKSKYWQEDDFLLDDKRGHFRKEKGAKKRISMTRRKKSRLQILLPRNRHQSPTILPTPFDPLYSYSPPIQYHTHTMTTIQKMAPQTHHQHTQTLLLMQKILSKPESSPLTLVLDSVEQGAAGLVKVVVGVAKVRVFISSFFLFLGWGGLCDF